VPLYFWQFDLPKILYGTVYSPSNLLNKLAIARAEGIFNKVITQYKKVKLLILDE
jgi:DNA replication protein DnaC